MRLLHYKYSIFNISEYIAIYIDNSARNKRLRVRNMANGSRTINLYLKADRRYDMGRAPVMSPKLLVADEEI